MFVSALFAAHAGPIAVVGLAGLSVAIWSQGSLAKAGEDLRDRLPQSAEPRIVTDGHDRRTPDIAERARRTRREPVLLCVRRCGRSGVTWAGVTWAAR